MGEPILSRWIWLFPVTYAVHIAEEYGAGFASWAAAHGALLTDREVLAWNGVGCAAMIIGVLLADRSRRWRWIVTALAVIVAANGLYHAAASVVTASYSPGLVSGALLWLPLGLFALRHEWTRAARSTFWKGVLGAVVVHVIVALGFIALLPRS